MTALAAPFLKPLDLVQVIDEASEVHLSPHVPSELRNSHRWLQATVVNKTPYKISVERSYFHSGEYFHAPTDIAPYGQMSFSCRNSTKAGVGGGTEFRVYATTDERWLYSVVFRIGWSCPELGSPRVGVATGGGPAKEAYDAATEGNQEARTDRGVAVGGNPNGTWKYMNLKVAAIRRGWEPVYIVEHFFENRE
ncbi:hypothetical protein K466DRAFT_664317 [Polyporus arcularius HHB13444]|uniref:Uncharacterized protein n=1 Tax=Polyporus arcularius HHB13444 TaxID=1314778 RepID=A0A5C3P9Y6_9APHY|nr:hypothetical protein K466DRAFT_664317 [Polyporus arcularius HHB13444]